MARFLRNDRPLTYPQAEDLRRALDEALRSDGVDGALRDLVNRVGYDCVLDEFSQVIEGRGLSSAAETGRFTPRHPANLTLRRRTDASRPARLFPPR